MLEIKSGHLTWVGPKQGLTVSIPDRHCALLNKNNDNALSLFFKRVMNNAISLIMQEKVMHYH